MGMQLALGMLNISGAHVLTSTAITRVTRTGSGYTVETSNGLSQYFDVLALAFPWESSAIEFVGIDPADLIPPRHPQITHATFFVARGIKGDALCSTCQGPPSLILSTENSKDFSSIGPIGKTDDGRRIYKIFSRQVVSSEWILQHFDGAEVDTLVRIPWAAYPLLNPSPFAPFKLGPNLYYLNAIESAASALELSVIAARNVALLIKIAEAASPTSSSASGAPFHDADEL